MWVFLAYVKLRHFAAGNKIKARFGPSFLVTVATACTGHSGIYFYYWTGLISKTLYA